MRKLLLVIFLSFMVTGCIGVNRNFKNTRNLILSSLDEDVNKKIEFSLCGAELSLAELFVSSDEDESQSKELLKNINNVEVGVYDRNFGREICFRVVDSLANYLRTKGLIPIVKVKDGTDASALFVNAGSSESSLNTIIVLSITTEQIVLVQVKGNIENLIEIAVKDKSLPFENSF